jgi:hypothetical protein
MTIRRTVLAALLLLACVAPTLPSPAQASTLVELDEIRPEKLVIGGFVLENEQSVKIEAVGFRSGSKRDDAELSSAWILNAGTRKVAWKSKNAESSRKSSDLRKYVDEVLLPAGRYEVYYSSFARNRGDVKFDGLGDVISKVVRGNYWGFDYEDYEDACREFFIKVEGDGRTLSASEITGYHDQVRDGALFSSIGLKADHYESVGLNLDREMDLEIYAVGEMDRNGAYDSSWIIDTKTNERVWRFDYRNSKRAGGAKKNRMARDVVKLPAGSYAIFCVTDDSHHYGKWNSAPPGDPFFWGITIQTADPGMSGHAKIGDYKNVDSDDVIVELIELRDSDFRSEGFTLKKRMKLRLYAIGEGEDRTLADYSWIVDAETRDVVWEMKRRDTEHAGGAKKNRMVDTIIELDKGDYIAYAATDGSHSYRDWNKAAPYDQKRWGLTIMVADGGRGDVKKYEDRGDKSTLAQLVGIGDNERKNARFSLDRDGQIAIYALGEGQDRVMNDYAWIENDRGRIVWEMAYRDSERAGGARKNRVVNETITLDAGEYTVYYKSDSSHSFAGWNAKPPRDRWNWGVTIKTVK